MASTTYSSKKEPKPMAGNLLKALYQELDEGTFRPVYLIFGEESYLIRQCRDRLKTALMAGGSDMNFNRYQGKEVQVPQVIDQAETLPFLAERRVILLERTGLLKSGGDELAEYIKDMPETTVIIMAEDEVDKRCKLYKAIDKIGKCLELCHGDEKSVAGWVGSRVKKNGKQLSNGAYQLFRESVGDDMELMDKELDKLLAYCMDRDVITEDDVRAICIRQITTEIFKMTDAMVAGNRKEVMKRYFDMVEMQESPMYILTMLTRQFRLMLETKDLLQNNMVKQDVMSKMGMGPYQADIYIRQSRGFSREYLEKAFRDCVDTDYRIKSGLIDMKMGVELLLTKYSSGRG